MWEVIGWHRPPHYYTLEYTLWRYFDTYTRLPSTIHYICVISGGNSWHQICFTIALRWHVLYNRTQIRSWLSQLVFCLDKLPLSASCRKYSWLGTYFCYLVRSEKFSSTQEYGRHNSNNHTRASDLFCKWNLEANVTKQGYLCQSYGGNTLVIENHLLPFLSNDAFLLENQPK